MASFLLSCITLLFALILPYCSMANITLGQSLSAAGDNSSWVSPSGHFAFGFRRLNNSDLYLLAIWYNKIPDRTIVWQANNRSDDNPKPVGPVPEGSKLELTETGLELKDHTGNTKWNAKPNTSVSDATMLDTGNFVLNASNSSVVWESYNSPTDTILPTQILELGSKMFSKLTETNFSKGRFQLEFSDGNLQLRPVAWPSDHVYEVQYYDSQTGNSSESGSKLVFNDTNSNFIYVEKNNGDITPMRNWDDLPVPTVEQYYRATLDFDGVFSLYSHEKNSVANSGWRSVRFIPGDICTALNDASGSQIGSGACGFNSYCQLLQKGKPSCNCPKKYEFVDPKNTFRGCKPTFRQSCEPDDGSRNPEELFDLEELTTSVNWPRGDYELLTPYNQQECRDSCLHDCSCAVVVSIGQQCWKKKLPLFNGVVHNEESNNVFYKVRKENYSSPGCSDDPRASNEKENSNLLLGAFLLAGFAIINLVLLVLVIFLIVFLWHRRKDDHGKNVEPSSFSKTNLQSFTYQELNEATGGFKEELGRGSFGIVYKGTLTTGSRNVIAVKKLDKLAQEREREFRTEVEAIGTTHHRNLVQLLGFCDQGVNRLLVYEFMSSGTLANFLFSLPRPAWNLRVRISLEIARGLLYLHEECNVPIIHCDIKPQNILLDGYFTAKISDFGLAKLLLSDQSRTRTMIRGTRGYVAPEWFKNVPVSAKVDVYSYGVMLLEIICCRRSVEMELEEENKAILTDWAYDCYNEGRLDVLVNEEEDAMADKYRLHKWLRIAIWCIQEDPSTRPTMKMVLHMLEGFLEVPEPPSPCSMCVAFEN